MKKLIRMLLGGLVGAGCWIIAAQIGVYFFTDSRAIIIAVVGLYLGIWLGFKIAVK